MLQYPRMSFHRSIAYCASIAICLVSLNACAGRNAIPPQSAVSNTDLGVTQRHPISSAVASATNLTLTPSALAFTTLNSHATITAKSRYAGTLYASSSNAAVVTVSPESQRTQQPSHVATFTVTALSVGNATITVTDKKGIAAQATASVSRRGTWTMKAPMPAPGGEFGVGVINGILYVVGATSSGENSSSLFAYNPATNSWSTKAPMPAPGYEPETGVIDNTLYVIDGLGLDGAMYAYNAATNTWTAKTRPPTTLALRGAGAGVINGVLYVAGGWGDASSPLNTLFAYDPRTDTWTSKAPMPTPRVLLSASVLNGALYAMGGFQYDWSQQDGGTGTDLATVEAYDATTNSWSSKASLPTPRERFGSGVIDGHIYAVGGVGAESEMLEYDPASNTWVTQTPLPIPLASEGVGAVNNVLYVMGGVNMETGDAVATMYAFTP